MSLRLGILSFLLLFSFRAFAQEKKDTWLVPVHVEGKDSVPLYTLPTVDIFGITEQDLEAIRRYNRLKYNILKVYPYAKWAGAKFNEINRRSEKMSSRERKRFIKDEEAKAKDQFEKELKKLTYSQGKILIKLIDRETGRTSYELVKELRGSLNAFFWQILARMFTADLKTHYDPSGEDKAMEQIVTGIERGEIK